jgi:hypothetical protein
VGAPPALVYRLLSDYEQHHPHILPPAFSDFKVEAGGIGAGTVISFQLEVGGRTQTGRMEVREPEPGRVLEEANERLTTHFTVDPSAEGSWVSIETVYESPGLRGLVERLLVPRLLLPIYRQELRLLDEYAREQDPKQFAL